MVNALLSYAGYNALTVTVLFIAVLAITRIWRSPPLSFALWLLVLVKLITPPILALPIPAYWSQHQLGLLPNSRITSDWAFDQYDLLSTDVSQQFNREQSIKSEANRPVPPLVVSRQTRDNTTPFRLSSFASPLGIAIVVIWTCGTLMLCAFLCVRVRRLRELVRHSPLASPELEQVVVELALKVNLSRLPEVRTTNARISPLVFGCFKPVLLLPSQLVDQLQRDQLRALVAHELAHLYRRDHCIVWIELFVLCIYWWQPIAWIASRQLRRSSDECCDGYVLEWLPGAGRSYSESILQTIDFLSSDFVNRSLVACEFGHFKNLKKRLEAIMKPRLEVKMSSRASFWLVFASVMVIGAYPIVKAEFDERLAAKVIAEHGGWCEADDDGNVIEVNLEYQPTGDGQRVFNPNDLESALEILPFFKKLKVLTLGGDKVSNEDLHVLSRIRHLQELNLNNCSQISDGGVEHLRDCQELESLQLTGSKITDNSMAIIGGLKNLRMLSLNDSLALTDDGLSTLSDLSRLEVLRLSGRGSQISGRGFAQLVKLPIRELGITHCPVNDDGAAFIAKMPSLETLWAGRTRFTDAGIAYFVGLPLKRLALLGAQLTDEGAMHLSRIDSLEELWIGQTQLTDASIKSLSRLANLKLIAFPPGISDEGRTAFSIALPTVQISFWHTFEVDGKRFATLINRESDQWNAYYDSSKPTYSGELPTALGDNSMLQLISEEIADAMQSTERKAGEGP